jgi:precorrin-3B C17-methyltransferase
MTFEAIDAIRNARFVVGYKPYIELLGDLVKDKEAVSGSMGKEVDRARQAVRLANEGPVALVSSGDPNIYGMAGLGLEVASRSMNLDDVDIIPGVTSFTAAACRAGILFRESVAVISLSDILTPWRSIEMRLRLAADRSMPAAIYNPKSHRRDWQLCKALEIYGEDAEVLIARNIGRDGEKIFWARAGQLLEGQFQDGIDMFTLVMICGRGVALAKPKPSSMINVVGIGPGCPAMVTLEAAKILGGSYRVYGAERYVQAIEGLSNGEKITHQGTCEERMSLRLREAREAADKGKVSSILTGGDPSIFSSAWRILEEGNGTDVHISPGVSAFSAVAARAGAPLVNDFILLSGSTRPSCIGDFADAGFGIVIYNVRGNEIDRHLRDIDPDRPCVLARDVSRSAEAMIVLNAGDLMDAVPSGFRFTLMIATANSYIKEGKIIARRGYGTRYSY